MIKDFLEPYFEESELKKLKEIVSKAKELKRTHGTSQEELDKVLFSLRYEIISLETKAFSRYTKQRDDTAILKDCLEIIQAVEPKDFSNNKFLSKKQPSDIVKFSFSISNNTDISYIENYFLSVYSFCFGFSTLPKNASDTLLSYVLKYFRI